MDSIGKQGYYCLMKRTIDTLDDNISPEEFKGIVEIKFQTPIYNSYFDSLWITFEDFYL